MTQVASETLPVFLQSGGSYKTTAERLMLREVTPRGDRAGTTSRNVPGTVRA